MVEEILKQDDKSALSDAPEYSSKSDFSKALIVADTMKRVLECRAKEMKKGYYNTTVSNDGNEIKTWIPDSRKEFISSVIALKLFLTPEIYRNERVKKYVEEFEESKKSVFEKFCYNELKLDEKEYKLKKTGNKFIPTIDSCIPFIYWDKGIKVKSEKKGVWNDKVQQYWDGMLSLYDKLFEELSCLLDSINYFKSQVRYG
jgi:hypothetical protein